MEDRLTQSFFQWVAESEGKYKFTIMFESAEGSKLFFRFDDNTIKIDFSLFTLECRTSTKPLRSYITQAQDLLIQKETDFKAGEISIADILSELAQEYQSKFVSDEEEFLSDESEDEYASKNFEISAVREETKAPAEEAKLDFVLEEKLTKLENAFSGQGSATANRRILQEYKYLMKSEECKGLSVDFEGGSNLYVWIVRLDINLFDMPTEIKQDFQKYATRYSQRPEIVFELRFDSQFPFSPPFLRVVRPRFQFRTGHITIGGSICMESLTTSGWIPVRTVESIFVEILFNMTEGEARLDPVSSNVEYSLAEAQEAFNRVARHHGWI